MTDEVQALRAQNELLRGHVKRLLKVEQSLYLSRRSLGRQVHRLDVLNRFANDAARLSDPAAVLRRGAAALFEVFPVEQCLGYFVRGGELVPAVTLEPQGAERALAAVRTLALSPSLEVPESAEIRGEEHFAESLPLAGVLQEEAAAAFGGPPARSPGLNILLPILGGAGERVALLFFRMMGAQSFHEEKPGAVDLPFLKLLGQQIAGAVENASLVASLSVSYQRLAEAQQELVKRERLSALGELSAVVAHEVRNPLAAMVNVISTLKRGQGPNQEALLGILSEEAGRLDQMVNDMLDFARPNSPTLRQESLAELVRESAKSALSAHGAEAPLLSFRSEAEDSLQGFVDGRMVRQAVVNLVLNAAQSAPAGGTITVALKAERRGDESVARIEVSDEGAGISEHDLERVFQPFFTTRATGTGLGLALVKRFVEAHQGEVLVSSTVGRGSTFTLLLPLGRAEIPTARVSAG